MSPLQPLALAPQAPARRLPRWQRRQKNFDAAGPAAADGARRASVIPFPSSRMSPRELANLPALKSAQRAEFLRRARQLGHHLDALAQGLEERRFFTTATADALRLLPAGALQPHPVPGFYQPPPLPGAPGRGGALVFASGPLAAGPRGPGHVQAVSIDTKVLGPGEQWDVGAPADEAWGPAGLPPYVVVNVRRLILHPGATVVVRGHSFSLLCQEYHSLAAVDAGAHQVAIGPAPLGAGLPGPCQLAELVFRDVQGPLAVHAQPAAHAPGQRVVLAHHVSGNAQPASAQTGIICRSTLLRIGY